MAIDPRLLGNGGTTPFGTGRRVGTNATFNARDLNEMGPVDRLQSIQDSSFVFNRLGLGRAIIKSCKRYALDGGLIPYSVSGDQQYDDSCNRFCDSLFESRKFDFTEEHDFYGMQEIGCTAVMVKGDLGVAQILERDDKGRIIGLPQLQLFQSEQISSSAYVAHSTLPTGWQWRDGVLYDTANRRRKFRVLKQPSVPFGQTPGANYHDYEARDFMLWLDAERVNQGRGMPWMQTGINSAMDMIDIVALEKQVARLNAYFGAVIRTKTGELGEGFENWTRRERKKSSTQDKDGETIEKQGTRTYADFFGGAAMPVLGEGEDIQFLENKRPSASFREFINWLAADIAGGFGVPISFVWALAVGTGPEVRFVMTQGDWFFREIARIAISRFCKPVRDWVIDYGILTGKINNGRLPSNGASPYLARWQLPRKASIDERHFFKTWMERLDKGLGTEEQFYADLGGAGDASHYREQRAIEMADWMRVSKKYKVPLPLLLRQTPGQQMHEAPGSPAKPAPDAEDDNAED
jgi:capsid protein